MKPPASNASTSAAAAHRIAPHADRLRANVARLLASRGHHGATDEEMAAALGLRLQTLTPRRWELAKEGRCYDSGARRPTSSGAEAIVWVLAPAAVHEAKRRAGLPGEAVNFGWPGAVLCYWCRRWHERSARLAPHEASPHCGRPECRERAEKYLTEIQEIHRVREERARHHHGA